MYVKRIDASGCRECMMARAEARCGRTLSDGHPVGRPCSRLIDSWLAGYNYSSAMPASTNIRPLTSADGMLLKHFRLTALHDTPTAFGSTYAREAAWTDDEWQQRAANWSNGTTSNCFVAVDTVGMPAGIAAGYIAAEEPGIVWLVSMWVSSNHRRQGIGRELVDRVEQWAKSIGASSIQLQVTEGNTTAEALYRQLGYLPTGERGPHQAHPGEIVYVMAKQLNSRAAVEPL